MCVDNVNDVEGIKGISGINALDAVDTVDDDSSNVQVETNLLKTILHIRAPNKRYIANGLESAYIIYFLTSTNACTF